jgi:2-polyprenyl-3-methyl-5-hydroxy-6-metoxy-1,4-benzoquinol methylase
LIAMRKSTCRGERLRAIDPLTLRRHSAPFPRRRFREEFRFRVLKNLQGKNVLDIGCGDGHNSVLLAKLSAQVTGIDISPKSIDLAHKKAEINGVKDATRFISSPVEEVEILPHSFDVI